MTDFESTHRHEEIEKRLKRLEDIPQAYPRDATIAALREENDFMRDCANDSDRRSEAAEEKLAKAAAHVHTIISHVNAFRSTDIYRGSLYAAVVALSDLFPEAKDAPAEPKHTMVVMSSAQTYGLTAPDERDAANALLRRVAANTEHAVEHDALVSEIREHLGETK